MSPQLAAGQTGTKKAPTVTDPEQSSTGQRQLLSRWAVVLSLLLVLVGAAALGGAWWKATQPPGDTSVEAGFARDMQTHHAQAVQMAMIIRDKTADPTLRALSYDIVTTQQQQIGQMYAWLTMWQLPQTPSQAPMAWMRETPGGHTMPMPDTGTTGPASATSTSAGDAQMPGMASPANLDRLQQASGTAAESQFLQLMIAHHQGGVAMAQAALDRTTNREVTTLARAIVTGQQAEIDQMWQLLQSRPAGG